MLGSGGSTLTLTSVRLRGILTKLPLNLGLVLCCLRCHGSNEQRYYSGTSRNQGTKRRKVS
jgi:hypothetical protein